MLISAASQNLPTFFAGVFGRPEKNLWLQPLGLLKETTSDLKTAFEHLEKEDMGA